MQLKEMSKLLIIVLIPLRSAPPPPRHYRFRLEERNEKKTFSIGVGVYSDFLT